MYLPSCKNISNYSGQIDFDSKLSISMTLPAMEPLDCVLHFLSNFSDLPVGKKRVFKQPRDTADRQTMRLCTDNISTKRGITSEQWLHPRYSRNCLLKSLILHMVIIQPGDANFVTCMRFETPVIIIIIILYWIHLKN